ncbi:MAG TPA: BamA/TamA family outer membrane protein [Blastocatellia bacterium]|nr:BamA/TamA family outer membrane protein [Blastocatellia bacterium]
MNRIGAAVIVVLIGGADCIGRQDATHDLRKIDARAEASSASVPQQFRLGKLRITGHRHTRERYIRRLILLSEGDVFDQSKWELGLEQINRTGLFDPIAPPDVVFAFDYGQGVVDVDLRLKERERQRIDLSAGAGTTGAASLGLDYANINLIGRGDRLSAEVRFGSREISVRTGYALTTLGKVPVTVAVSAFYGRLEFVDARTAGEQRRSLFVDRSSGASLGVSVPLTRSSYKIGAANRIAVSYSFASTGLADRLLLPGSASGAIEQTGIRSGSITPAFVHYSLDREFDPLSGQHLIVAIELSGRSLGGSYNSIRPMVDYRRFYPLGRREGNAATGEREPRVLGLRVRASHIAGAGKPFRPEALAAVGGIPVFKRFFLGGETEVRGYDVNSLAPLGRVDRLLVVGSGKPIRLSSELRPIGGDTEIILNAEYRVPLIWRLSAAAFLDVGSSFNLRRIKEERIESPVHIEPPGTMAKVITVLRPPTVSDGDFPAYRVSLGGELRINVPIVNVPLRLILAANPNAQLRPAPSTLMAPEKRFAFSVALGRTL